eukprot:TRINITY_DN21911_c0_g1_i2.p1 TRINITY_DN21911_c0_g1~~TRINITY_DN21911_c0_g1_i2.p1  ORF type:complete len:358 (+),score=141.52 TRINITY_DN21911_c0_g1_i2:86-1075(+)
MWAPKRELDTEDLRPGYDAVRELRPTALDWVNCVNALIIAAVWAAGLAHADPELWLRTAGWCCLALAVVQFATALPFQFVASRCGRLIQTSPTAQPEYVWEELKQTVVGYVLVVGPIIAWPATNARMGRPTALSWDLDYCVSDVLPAALPAAGLPWAAKVAVYLAAKLLPAVLIADAYNYWKHRLFHTKLLWPFHKYHHSHRNPSALAGYAVSPAFGFATFAPVYAYGVPGLGMWAPATYGFLLFYLFVNHYIHCGFVIDPVERLFAPCWVMTSAWHNTHHNRGRVGFYERDQTFAEMLSLWDYLLGTYPQGAHARAVQRATSVSGKCD